MTPSAHPLPSFLRSCAAAGAPPVFFPKVLKALRGFFPREQRCPVCAAVYALRGDEGERPLFCPDCAAALRRREKGYCPDCGEPAAWPDLPPAPCLRCLAAPPPWDAFVFHGIFQGLLRQLLLSLKFSGRLSLAPPLGLLLAGHPDAARLTADCVVPVPLHRSRLASRGYNQALQLARPLAAALDLPCEPRLLERIRATAPQTGMSLSLRRRNILGAFAASALVKGARILLLDDIVTTGATLKAAANALREAGAIGVSVAAVGRTARPERGAVPLSADRHQRAPLGKRMTPMVLRRILTSSNTDRCLM